MFDHLLTNLLQIVIVIDVLGAIAYFALGGLRKQKRGATPIEIKGPSLWQRLFAGQQPQTVARYRQGLCPPPAGTLRLPGRFGLKVLAHPAFSSLVLHPLWVSLLLHLSRVEGRVRKISAAYRRGIFLSH